MKSSQKKQKPDIELKQNNSNVTLHVYKTEEKVPLKTKKPEVEATVSAGHYFNLGSYLVQGLQKILTPSTTPTSKSLSKTPDEFVQAITDDTVLENLKVEIAAKKKEVRDEERKGRLHIFNREIEELITDVKYKIEGKAEVIQQMDEEDDTPDKKMKRIAEYREERDNFKEDVSRKLQRVESELLESTKKELYDHLKQAIVNPIWDLKVNQTIGGKKVINSESPKSTIHVPTGIEKMIRVLSNSTLDKNTSCCCIKLFSRPAPASRIIAQSDEVLSAKKVLKKVTKIIEIAKERLNASRYTRCELTRRFYAAIAGIDVNQLGNFEILNVYVFKFEQINRTNNLEKFLMMDEESEEENVRRRPSISDVP